jgi:hypothetical protein
MEKLIDFADKMKKTKVREPDKVLTNVRVEWVDWGGSANNRIRIERDEEGCTVKFYGKKRTIIFPDGSSIDKMEGPNLKIYLNQM